MGFSILGSAVLTFLVMIKGHRSSILGGEDSETVKAAWQKSGNNLNTISAPEDKDGFDESA
jgi:hypothetical protein